MRQKSSTEELINRTVGNFSFTLNEIINQVRNANPHLHLYKGQGDSYNYDPSGLIERISLQLHWAFTQNGRVDGLRELYYERGGTYDHREVQSFLEETLQSLKTQSFTTMISLQKFYIKFLDRLRKFKE